MMKKLFLITLLVSILGQGFTQNIKRKAFVGITATNLTDSISKTLGLKENSGVLVTNVAKGSTAENLKIKTNDVILKVNSSIISSVKEYKLEASKFKENDTLAFLIIRNKKTLLLKGKAVGLAYETSENFDIVYDEVKFMDGWMRVIINKPKSAGKHKAIFFIQGYTCYSLDNIGKHPYGQLIDKLCEKGYVVIRVEKPGMGDNTNTPDCSTIDFNTEVDAFCKAYEKFKTYDYVDTSNIYIFGHSLGGIEAPILGGKYHPKGVIACGTTYVSWFEYIIAMFRFQNIITGVEYVDNEKLIRDITPMLYELLINKKIPAELAKNPAYEKLLIDNLEWDGNGQIWSRNYSYWQELQDQNMAETWKANNENVLIVRGEGDFEAFSTAEHQSIVDIVNFYHPGNATFKLIPNMDHAFAKSKTPEESYKNGQISGYYYNNFNDAIIEVVDEWIGSLK
jgi:uncharacterized protein